MSKYLLCLLSCLTGFMLHAQVTIDGEQVLKKTPWNFYYSNSFSQTIYQSNIINASGEITGIKLLYADSSTDHTNEITLFLGHTTQTEFSDVDNWVDPSGLTEVFSGDVDFVPGTWVEINFTTPFQYNGVDNLVIAGLESTDGYDDSSDNFVTTNIYYNSSLISYSDSNTILPSDPPLDSSSGTTNIVMNNLPQIQLLGINTTCEAPSNLVTSDITQSSANISWDESTTISNYNVVYKANENFDPYNDSSAESITSTDATITLGNLSAATTYYVYVQSVCSGTDSSSFTGPVGITTLAGAVDVPYTQDFEGDDFPPLGWQLETVTGNDWEIYEGSVYTHSGDNSLRYRYHSTEEANSWIFSIGVSLEAGKTYDVSFWQRLQSSNYEESLKLTVGTDNTIAAQSTLLWSDDSLNNTSYEKRSAFFTPDTSGTYYFALQANSPADYFYIYVDDFSIEEYTLFTLLEEGPGSYYYSSLNWGDYDNDGDADLLIAGTHPTEAEPYEAGTSTTHVYTNDGNGNLTLNEDIQIQPVHAGEAKWIDFDNDGDLDIIMMGIDFQTAYNMYALYENDNGTFTEVEANTSGVSWGGISIGDYDNDGDVDVLMSGWNVDDTVNGYASTYIWKNEEGILVREDMTAAIPGVFGGRADWVDVDNDMDLDIVSSPEYDGAVVALRVFTNEDGAYSLTQTIEEANSYNMLALGDYDNDGFTDVAIEMADEDYNNFVQILRNNAGTFEFVTNLPSVSSSAAATPIAWGDYDNDGDLDLAISGLTDDYDGAAMLYENNNGSFTIVDGTGFLPIGGHSLAWQDVDGDLDLDILITGFLDDESNGEFYALSKLYRNDTETANTAPVAPQSLSSTFENGILTLNWSDASDEQTVEEGLNYYLQVGTTSGGIDVAHYPVAGNAWRLENVPAVENLYWCVKSIDTSFIQSECSEEQTISTLGTSNVATNESRLEVYPNPVKDGVIHLVTSHLSQQDLDVKIFDMQGKLVYSKPFHNAGNVIEISVKQLSTGKYFLQYSNSKEQSTIPVLIK